MWVQVRHVTVAVDGSEDAAEWALVEGGMSKNEKGGGSMGEKDRCVVGVDLVGKRELVEFGLGALLVRRAFVPVLFPYRLRPRAFVEVCLELGSLQIGVLACGGWLHARAGLVSFGLGVLVIVVTSC